MSYQECTGTGGTSCTTKQGEVTLDANWRWTHVTSGFTNCYTDNTWNETACPSGATCSKNCVVDGADYSGTYGVSTSGNALTLKFVTKGSYSTNIGSRTYLMESATKYKMLNLVGKEFSFDVDVSKLPCGLNGALYTVEMAADGGMGKGNNKAGAKFGTGKSATIVNWDCTHVRKVTATLNVLMTSSGSMAMPTLRVGSLVPTTRTREAESWAPAALRWISGRLTPSPRPTHLTPARNLALLPARAPTAVMATTATVVFATRTAATLT